MNHINTDLDHTDSNHINLNQTNLIHTGVTNHDSAKFCTSQQTFSWDRDLMDTAASTTSKITPTYVSLIHTAHTPSQVHSFHLYPPVPATQIFTYGKIDPP